MTLLGAGSPYTLPSEAGARACPTRADVINSSRSSKGTASAVLGWPGVAIHLQGWILLFLLGPKPLGFLRAPGTAWDEQRWQGPDLQELLFSSSVQSNLIHRHLSQLDVDTILNMEMEENSL